MATDGVRRSRVSHATEVPCAARPATGYRHLDGACQCFFGGPPPMFPAAIDPTRAAGSAAVPDVASSSIAA